MSLTFMCYCCLFLSVGLNTSTGSICRPKNSHHYFLKSTSLLNMNDSETTVITGTTAHAADYTEVTHSDLVSSSVKLLKPYLLLLIL